MATFEDYWSDEAAVRESIDRVRPHLRQPDASRRDIAAFEWWVAGYDLASAATSYEGIKAAAKLYLCTPHAHAAPTLNVSQGLMKATVHRLHRELYRLQTAAGHMQAGPALRDAMAPPRQRAAEYFDELLREIASENGETVATMTERVCRAP